MKPRRTLILVGMAICLTTLALALTRQQHIANLRTQQQDMRSQTRQTAATGVSRQPSSSPAASRDYSPSVELLRLRNQVTQLGNRKRELAGVRAENERLRAQLAASKTNSAVASGLPPDYVLRSRARQVGYSTPEDTLQTFLWALQNKDFRALTQSLTSESAQRLEAFHKHDESLDAFFRAAEELPGARVLRHAQSDGSVELRVEFIPGVPAGYPPRLRQIGNQWKIEGFPH